MFKFIKDSIAEFEHVVWPTPNETRKYVSYVITVIVGLTLFLAIIGYVLSHALSWSREKVQEKYPTSNEITTPIASGEDYVTNADINEILKNIHTGSTQSGHTNSGTLVTPIMTGSQQ